MMRKALFLLIWALTPLGANAKPCAPLLSDNASLIAAHQSTLRFFITNIPVHSTNKTLGTTFNSRRVELILPQWSAYLHKEPALPSNAHFNLRIEIQNRWMPNTRVRLPPHMAKKIVEFLVYGAPNEDAFDCNSFVHFVNGLEHPFGKLERHRWTFTALESEKKLKAGDTVVIGNQRGGRLKHVAIYLAQGLYLSKFGIGGFLIVADLEGMKAGYESKDAWVITPTGFPSREE